MDPVTAIGAAAAVLQLVGVAGKAIKYLNDIKNAPRERFRLIQELNSLYGILIELESHVDEAEASGDDQWLRGLQSLAVKFGPIEQLRTALEAVVDKVKPAPKIKKFGKAFIWPFTKKEIEETLKQIERQKSTIIFALQGDQINLAKAIKADTMHIPALINGVQEMQVGVMHLQDRQEIEAAQRIVDWFSPLSFGDRHNDVLSRRCEGTGNWLFETREASAWLSNPEKTSLWCSGIPGAGKTTIAAIVTEHIEQTLIHDQSTAVACLYCSYKDKMVQTPANLLANTWMQIRQTNGLAPEVEDLYASSMRKGSSTRPRLDDIIQILKAEVNRHVNVYVIIDALDECEPAYRLRLVTELKALQPKLKLMVTSRYFDAFGADMGIDTDIEVLASDTDIRRYVQERLSSAPRLGRWIAADTSLQAGIEAKVIDAAQNMFLMAKLLLDSLVTKMTRKALQEAIDELPRTLNDTYDDAMIRIKKQNEDEKNLAERVLSWISYAFRPFNVMELRHALAVTPGESHFDEANMPDEEDLPTVCAGLIYIEEGSNIVRLAHYTAQDYMESNRDQNFVDARHLLAATCLTYLNYEGNRLCRNGRHYIYRFGQEGYSEDIVDGSMTCPHAMQILGASETAKDVLDGDRTTFYHAKNGIPLALYQYAAHYWARHIKDRLEKELQPLAMKFILNDMNRQMALGVIRHLWWTTRIKGPLTVAVHYDLRHICHVLLEREAYDLSDFEGEGYRSLLSAAELGRDRVIKLLLEKTDLQSLIDNDDPFVLTPVAWVAWTGNRAAVRFLLHSAGIVSADDRDPESGRYSVYESQKLPEGLDPLIEGLKSLDISTSIPLIAVLSNVSTLQAALSDVGANIEDRDPTHEKTALHHASQSGRTGIVKLLLSSGADVRATDFYGETPLHYAVDSGNLEVVKMLVEAGSDLDARNDNGELPTEMLRMRAGDIPCPVHQDELWEETHEYLFGEMVRREGKEMQLRQTERREFRKKYGASWREFHKEAESETL